MKKFVLTWPDFNTRAFTMSYDDGTVQDIRIMDFCRRFKMGCTFALVTDYLGGMAKYFNHLGQNVYFETVHDFRVKFRYDGFEIAGHTKSHASLAKIKDEEFEAQVKESNKYLSELVGYEVRGMTYPMGSYDDRVCENLKRLGVAYSRTADSSHAFDLPDNFLQWHPTCHDHDPEVFSLVDKCLSLPDEELKVFYVWGHAYELDKPDSYITPGGTRWQDFEALLSKVSKSEKFWCVSNIEVCDYANAAKKLVIGKDFIRNESDKELYGLLDGEKITISPGEKAEI